jgi:hypothetical protein
VYLHIGQETVVPLSEIVGIFDIENTTISKNTRSFLNDIQKRGEVITVSDDLPKSFVVCVDKQGAQTVYISQISCATLLKRAEMSYQFE